MKSQAKASPQRSRFASRSCSRFSPDQRHPRLRQGPHLVEGHVLGGREDLHPRAHSLADALEVGADPPRVQAPDQAGHRITSTRGPPGDPFARRRDGARRRAPADSSCTPRRPPPASTPARSSRRRATRRRLSIRPSATSGPQRLEGGQDLVADLVAAGADSGADRRRLRLDLLDAARDDPGCHAPPAAVDHRHAPGPGERHRQAVGDEHERRQLGPRRGMAVDLRQAGGRIRVRRRVGRPIVPGHLGAVHLPADQDELRIDRDRGGQPVAVLAHRIGQVPGQPPQVEALERALR